MKLVHVGGAKGVGKTTVLDTLAQSTNLGCTIQTIHSSTELKQYALESYGKNLGELNRSELFTIQSKLITHVSSLKCDLVIFDTHYIDIGLDGSIVRLMPREHEAIYKYHVIIEAPAAEVLTRRLRDKSRVRSLDISMIDKEITEERIVAHDIASRNGAVLFSVNNLNTEETISELGRIVKLMMLKRD